VNYRLWFFLFVALLAAQVFIAVGCVVARDYPAFALNVALGANSALIAAIEFRRWRNWE